MQDEPIFRDLKNTQSDRGDTAPLEVMIKRLVATAPFAVLCTQGHGQPYGSVVAFAFSSDLSAAVFATPHATRKYRLLTECARVSLVIDNRPDFPDDMMRVEALTITGRAIEVERGETFDRLARMLTTRHPYLQSFVQSQSCALFRVEPTRFLHVWRFQEVRQWIPPQS